MTDYSLPWSLPIDTGVSDAGIIEVGGDFVEFRRCFLATICGEEVGAGDKGPGPLSLSFFFLL